MSGAADAPLAPPPPPPAASGEAGEPPEERKRKRDHYYDDTENLPALAAKDDLTLMVRQLHPKTGDFDVFQAFSKAGKVVDVRLISDERSGRPSPPEPREP